MFEKKFKVVHKDMERISNDHPAVAFRKRYSRQKEQQENMSKEMKSVVCSENFEEFGVLDQVVGPVGCESNERSCEIKKCEV